MHISQDVAQKVFDMSKDITDLKEKAKSEPLGTSADLINKQKEMAQYVDSFRKNPH